MTTDVYCLLNATYTYLINTMLHKQKSTVSSKTGKIQPMKLQSRTVVALERTAGHRKDLWGTDNILFFVLSGGDISSLTV